MACPPQDVTETELAILQVLWGGAPSTTRQITEVLYPGGGMSHYATVQSLLLRLQAKGLVAKRRGGKANVFAAAVRPEVVMGRRLSRLAKQFCMGSLSPLLTHLVKSRGLSPEERRQLRALLDELDRRRTRKPS
jgi:predicted transcriptional regulator